MAMFDKESEAFDWIRKENLNNVIFFTNSQRELDICRSIFYSTDWIDNSLNTNNPPDYYNDTNRLMMDFMQVNDYEIAKSQKVVNDIKRGENNLIKEVKESGILDCLPNVANIYCNPNVEIKPSYDKYFKNFERVYKKHCNQLDIYKRNHPGYETIFMMLDLSESTYILKNAAMETSAIYHVCGDRKFMSVIKGSNVDYVVWYMPYLMPSIDNPRLIIIDRKELDIEKCYDFSNMVIE